MDYNVEHLISEVYARPVLWNQSSKNYHNRFLVEKYWSEIEKALETPKDCIKKKWKNLRDQFRNELKKIPLAKSGDSGISEKQYSNYTTWPHFKSMLFIKDQMRPRTSVGNLEASSSRYASEASLHDTSLVEVIQPEIQELCEYDPLDYEPKKKKAKTNVSTQLLANYQKKLMLLESKINAQKEKDDDQAFFDSVLPYMRKMDINKKLLCRMEIQKIIYDFATNTYDIN